MALPPYLLSVIQSAINFSIGQSINLQAYDRFGFNAPSVNYYEGTKVYADLLKSAPNFWTSGVFTGPGYPVQVVPLKSNGWPSVAFSMIVMANDTKAGGSGIYKAKFTGSASLETGGVHTPYQNKVYDSANDLTTLEFVLADSSFRVSFSNLSSTFGDLKIMRPGHEFSDKYSKHFVELYNRASFIRFMDFLLVNGDGTIVWLNPSSSLMNVGLLDAIDMCNDLSKQPWLCVPILASDSYVNSFATYLKNNLNVSKPVIIELSNEVWNVQFFQCFWAWSRAIYDAKVLQNEQPKNFSFNLPNRYETLLAEDSTNKPTSVKVRRVSNEVYIKHPGVIPFRTGERWRVTRNSSLYLPGIIPAIGSFITVTEISPTEFKFSNPGLDFTEKLLSTDTQPLFVHEPIISVEKIAGVVTVTHDGSLTISNSVLIDGKGTMSGISGKVQSMLVNLVPTILSGTSFAVTLPTAGADISLVNSFNATNCVIIYTETSNDLSRNIVAGSSTFNLQRRWYVNRIKQISDIFKQVYLTEYSSKVKIVVAGQPGELGTGSPLRLACDWIESLGVQINSFCDYASMAQYISWKGNTEYSQVKADSTGTTGAQLLLDRVRNGASHTGTEKTVAYAKRKGIKTAFYEVGIDTATPLDLVDNAGNIGISVAIREATQHNPLMQDVMTAMCNVSNQYDVDLHCQYGGYITSLLDGTGSSIFVSWHVAEQVQSISPIGQVTSQNAYKLKGIDNYLLSPLSLKVGGFTVGQTTTASSYQFLEQVPSTLTWTSAVFASAFSAYGGLAISSSGSAGAGFGSPRLVYLVYSDSDKQVTLNLSCKTDNRGISNTNYSTTLNFYANDQYQGQLINPGAVDTTAFSSTGSFSTNSININLKEGANLLQIDTLMPQTRSHTWVLSNISLG